MTETMYCHILNYLITKTSPSEVLPKYTDTPEKHNGNGQRHNDGYDVDIFPFTCCGWPFKNKIEKVILVPADIC